MVPQDTDLKTETYSSLGRTGYWIVLVRALSMTAILPMLCSHRI